MTVFYNFLYFQIGDLLGTAFLALSFMVLSSSKDDFLLGIESGQAPENMTEVLLVGESAF